MLFRRVNLIIGIVEKVFISVGLGMFFLIVPFITTDVILRYFFNRPMLGSIELSEIAMAILLFLCMGYVTRLKGHFSVEILSSRLPSNAQVILDRIGYLIGLFVCILIVYQGIKRGIQAFDRNEATPLLDIPMYPFRLLLPVGGLLCCIELILHFIGSFGPDGNRDRNS